MLVTFCTVVYLRVERLTYRQVDVELEGAANSLVSVLRAVPRRELETWNLPFPPEVTLPPGFQRGPSRIPNNGEPFPRLDNGPPRWQQTLELPPAFMDRNRDQKHYFVVWQGPRVLRSSPDAPELARLLVPDEWNSPSPFLSSLESTRYIVQRGPMDTTVLVAKSMEREEAELRRWLMLLSGATTIFFVIGILGGFWISQRALTPLVTMSDVAASISVKDLKQRIETKDTDVELQHLANTLNRMFDRLERSFEQQAAFTANASHELRTPLTIIITQLELLQRKSKNEIAMELGVCERAAKRMKGLVEQLLLLARADSGNLTYEPQVFDLSEVTDECLDLLEPLAKSRDVILKRELAPCEVTGDPGLLSQVVINLVTNAIQYNRVGGEVHVCVAPDEQYAKLIVCDNGVGIPLEFHPQVFERFFRCDTSRSRDSGGNGLGLSISQSIVQAHSGSLTFKSVPNQGSEFMCSLPQSCDRLNPEANRS